MIIYLMSIEQNCKIILHRAHIVIWLNQDEGLFQRVILYWEHSSICSACILIDVRQLYDLWKLY